MYPLPLCYWWPSDHAPTATLASPQAKIVSKKQRENQKVHATLQPTLAPAKIVLEKYAIRKPCCKCTGIAVGASNLSQPWRFLPCLQILLTLSYHIMLTKSFWSIYARVQLLSIHVVPRLRGGGHKERGKTTITVSKKIRGAADTT